MTDDIVTRLRYRAKVCNHGLSPNAPEGTEVYITIPCDRCEPLTQAADEIERLRKLMSDYVSLWYQVETGRSFDGVYDPENVVKAYHAKFHEMKEAVRHDES